jgi:hypothetical protein
MTFALIDSVDILDGSTTRRIALYEGDLTEIPKEHRADILVVSAFPNDYAPTSTSLIGSLYKRGLSVDDLAEVKAHDLRATCGFWLSKPIEGAAAALNIGRIACFEPLMLGSPGSIVGDLFRGLFPFLDDRKDQVVAMPVLAAGDQESPSGEMLSSILDAASRWLARGLAISELMIVERAPDRVPALARTMADFKRKMAVSNINPSHSAKYDVFLSFSRNDAKAADFVRAELEKREDTKKVFDFRIAIEKGKSWQEELDRAIGSSRCIVSIMSPSYFSSPECKEELMQARLRNKRSNYSCLFPIYWCDGDLDLWIQAINYADCREADFRKLKDAVGGLVLH